jgi:hypothetical protein
MLLGSGSLTVDDATEATDGEMKERPPVPDKIELPKPTA